MFRLDRIKHRLIKRIEFLVAASARARIKNRVGGVAVKIRVTRIDFSEVGEQRNQCAAALINSVADFVNPADFIPRIR